MTFSVEPLDVLPEIWCITPTVFRDDRGEFLETWRADQFPDLGIDAIFVQDNQSRSRRGVLRGLHYQLPPHAQGKLVGVVYGEVFDVAVDVRRSSPSFGSWAGRVLSGENHRMLWIPEGFAHGYLTLSESAVVTYKATGTYVVEADRSVRWNDPDIGIDWPDAGGPPTLSPKDAHAPHLGAADVFP